MTGAPIGAAVWCRGLSKAWPGLSAPVLDGVDWEVEAGSFAAVTGPSGAGKSTLLALLAGLCRSDSGQVLVAGEPVDTLDDDGRARLRATIVGLLFQDARVLPAVSALDNVALPLLLKGVPTRIARDRAASLLERLGLAGRLHAAGRVLSGGERHRVALARALVHRPRVVLGDEPTASLDPATARVALSALAALRAEEGVTLIVATHDPLVTQAADGVWALRGGKLTRRRGAWDTDSGDGGGTSPGSGLPAPEGTCPPAVGGRAPHEGLGAAPRDGSGPAPARAVAR